MPRYNIGGPPPIGWRSRERRRFVITATRSRPYFRRIACLSLVGLSATAPLAIFTPASAGATVR
jgi:hypothetical protein